MPERFMRTALFWIITGILAAVPLVFWRGVFFPYTFTKTILFYVLVDAAFAIWLYLMAHGRLPRPRFTLITTMVAAFLVIIGVASVVGIDVSKSIWSDYERMFGLITWLHMGAFFLMAASMLQADRERTIMMRTIIGTAVLVALYAVWQGITTADLSISTIGNAAYLSSYLVPVFFLILLAIVQEKQIGARTAVYAAGAVLMLAAIAFTQARAGIVGLAAGLGSAGFLFLIFGDASGHTLSFSNRLLKKIAGALLITGIAAGIVVIAAPDFTAPFVPRQFGQLVDFSTQERTAEGRLLVWGVAWEGWKEAGLFGVGPENFNILFNRHYIPALHTVEPWFDRAHNFLFDIGTTSGIPGLLAYLGMFAAAATAAVRRWRRSVLPPWHMIMLISLLGAHLAQNMFTFDTISSALILFFVFAYIASFDVLEKEPANNFHNRRAYARLILGAAYAGLAIFVYAASIQPLRANIAAHAGWELLRTGGGDEAALTRFEKSISYHTQYSVDARRFAAEYVFEFLKQGGQRPDESIERLMHYGIEKMNENITVEPENVKWVMYRGELYSLLAQKFDASFAAAAEQDFLRARTMSSGRPQVYLELAQARKLQGDSDAAWEYLDHAATIAPRFMFTYLNAAALAIETGNEEREREARAALSEYGSLDSEVLRDAYAKARRYQDAAAIQELLIVRANAESDAYSASQRALLYAQLAALYQLAGQSEQARNAAFMVLELDPARKDEVAAFLETLE